MWPFPRRAARPPIFPMVRDCGETWRVGDVAECIADDWQQSAPPRRPMPGSRAIVLEVEHGRFDDGSLGTALTLLGYDRADGWDATAFRKIVLPDVEAEDCADESLPVRKKLAGRQLDGVTHNGVPA